MGDYLGTFRWSHFATFTMRKPHREAVVKREFLRAVDRLASETEGSIRWFYSIEVSTEEFFHVHALLYGTQQLTVRQVAGCWRLGFARVSIYDPGRLAAWYASKRLRADSYDLFLSANKPPRAA